MAIEAKRADTSQRRSPQPKGRKNATPKPVIIADAAAKITEVVNGIRRGRKKWAVHSKAIRKKMADSPRHHGSNLAIPVSSEVATAATQPMITSATTVTAIRPEATRDMSLSFFVISVIKVLPSPGQSFYPTVYTYHGRSQRAALKASSDGYWAEYSAP